MRPSEEIFPPAPSAANYSLPIPIVSVTTSSSSPSSSSSSSSSSASSVPRSSSAPTPSVMPPPAFSSLPPTLARNEPAVVLGCANGQVRRMRSVLDMKLGAMAGNLHLHDAATSAPNIDIVKIDTVERQTFSENVSDRNKLARVHAQEKEPAHQAVDVFGIPIPRLVEKDTAAEDVLDSDSIWGFHGSFSMSSVSDGKCSVVLAESPSRLDLSALLC